MYPNCTIYFLGQIYTKDVIELCEHVDKFIDWQEIKKMSFKAQIAYLKKLNISIALHIFPNIQISWLLKRVGVPIRIGSSRRWYHWLFCNKKISFTRRQSNLHESQLNTNLLIPLGLNQLLPLSKIAAFYGVVPPNISDELTSLIDPNKFNIILHPKSRGNGKEWGLENYSRLISLLDSQYFKIFISGTQNEYKNIHQAILKKHPDVIDLVGKISLKELIGFMSKADGLVASSTGPLHLAAATGIHAIGLYAPIRPIFSKRWAPVGYNAKTFEAKKICVKCNNKTKCDCLMNLNPLIVSNYIKQL
jgi:ADP-heptose:LPS heptosyltransferase